MIYLIIGEQSLIDKEIKNIIKKENSNSIIKYDLIENSICDVCDDINTINLFNDKKIIICSNLNRIDKLEELINYIDNQNDNILILTSEEKIDNKIMKSLKDKKINIIDVSNIDLTDYIKKEFNDYKISFKEINMIKDYTSNDYNRINNEIKKLKMYKLDEKIITEEDIRKIVKKDLDKNIFDLINYIYKKDKNKIFEVYYELIKNNEDELKIIGFLSNNYTLIYKIKELIKIYNDEECMLRLNKMHPYRFKLLKEQALTLSTNYLLEKIKELGDLDINIKSGYIDKKLGMELFFSRI